MRQIKKMMQRGLLDPEKEDPFSLFVASTNIRYCFYHDTHKVLGNTFGMCVLQVCDRGPSPCSENFTCIPAHFIASAGLDTTKTRGEYLSFFLTSEPMDLLCRILKR